MISVLSWLEGAAGWSNAPMNVRNILKSWRLRSETRRALARLTPYELDDIGLTPDVAAREASKPFWQK